MYESFYKLTGKPFQLSPDPDFYYESRVHKRAYAYLEYGLYQGEGFIVITGEVGAGKTTVVRNLLANLDQSKVVAAHLVSTMLDADDLVRSVCAAFGLATKGADKASLLTDLEEFLKGIAAKGRRALLIVDEAQNLSPRAIEELRMLSNFQVGDRALLQSFLIGQPELRRIMQHHSMQQLRQRIIASYHLGPLDREEAERYIQHRLRHVGWKGDPRVESEAFDAVFAFTSGIPRRINLVFNRLMLSGFLRDSHHLEAADVEAVARELREELGAVMPANEILAGRADDPDYRVDEPGGHISGRDGLAQAEADGGAEPGEPGIPGRVVRLERTLNGVLLTLRKIVHAIEPGVRPGGQARP
ncbi:MAG: XrtA/PEP-CTERM system-associated ATPase [Betaproteobacteria bacterium]|jgi:putative secretion ATPase (PEP-CTERM system associated)